jgi:heterodisulfide reductase subunit C
VAAKKSSEKPVPIDHTFREQLGLVLEGDGVSYCYQCGACVGDCPSARFSEDFNPRNIMLAVLYGMKDEVIGEKSVIWKCSNCFTCFDRCPQDVKPIEVIIALKNLMAKEGRMPKGVDRMVAGLLNSGRSAMVTSATYRRRTELGLPDLPEVDVDELRKLLEDPDAEPGGDGKRPASPPSDSREISGKEAGKTQSKNADAGTARGRKKGGPQKGGAGGKEPSS